MESLIAKDIVTAMRIITPYVYLLSPDFNMQEYLNVDTLISVDVETVNSDIFGMGSSTRIFENTFMASIFSFAKSYDKKNEIFDFINTNYLKVANIVFPSVNSQTIWCDRITSTPLPVDSLLDAVEKFPYRTMTYFTIHLISE
jgi:hypothetical protein